MSNLQKHQGKIFDGSNMPEFYRYIADYLDEYGAPVDYGLEFNLDDNNWKISEAGLLSILKNLSNDGCYKYRPTPLTKTMYNIHTGEAVEVPVDIQVTVSVAGSYYTESLLKLTSK